TDEEMLEAILAHAGHCEPTGPMGQALCAVDPLTGLIVAAALVHPERLGGLTTDNILNRYKEKDFARSASREGIASCRKLGTELPEFVSVVLAAMQENRDDLGL
ncbi:MAG: phosphohydrolase, partial [Candidatus Bipolaricaulota bacterium]